MGVKIYFFLHEIQDMHQMLNSIPNSVTTCLMFHTILV